MLLETRVLDLTDNVASAQLLSELPPPSASSVDRAPSHLLWQLSSSFPKHVILPIADVHGDDEVVLIPEDFSSVMTRASLRNGQKLRHLDIRQQAKSASPTYAPNAYDSAASAPSLPSSAPVALPPQTSAIPDTADSSALMSTPALQSTLIQPSPRAPSAIPQALDLKRWVDRRSSCPSDPGCWSLSPDEHDQAFHIDTSKSPVGLPIVEVLPQ